MTAPRDPDRLIEAFFEEGSDLLPDWAYDEVRHDIHRTRQRVVIGPWGEPRLFNLARYGVIAAAIVLLVGAGAVLFRPTPAGIAGPAMTPSASASPTEPAEASPTLRPNALPPGPIELRDDETGGPAGLTVTVPAGGSGWTTDGFGLWKDYGPNADQPGPVIHVWPGGITGTYLDPCTDHRLKEPAPTGVEDLIAALGNQPGVSSEPPVDLTVSGYAGQYVQTTVAADITECGDGESGFWLWSGAPAGDRRYVQGTGEINRIYAFDIDGERFTFDVRLPAETTDADWAEVMSMLETIEITPVVASPSP